MKNTIFTLSLLAIISTNVYTMERFNGINNNNAPIVAEIVSEEEYEKNNCMNIEVPSYQPFNDMMHPTFSETEEEEEEEESSIDPDILRNITIADVTKLLTTIQQTKSSQEDSSEGDITQVFEVEDSSAEDAIPTIHPLLRGLTNQKSAAKKAVAKKIQKIFPCTYAGCDKSFTSNVSLTNHMCVHTGERPFTCTHEGCDKSFTTKGNLVMHMRTHTEKKRFACELCSEEFTWKKGLDSHLRTQHPGISPYICLICNKAFRENEALNGHMYLTHIR